MSAPTIPPERTAPSARADRLVRTALWMPLTMIVWLPVSTLVGMVLVDALNQQADAPATDWGWGGWLVFVLFNLGFVMLPLYAGLGLARIAAKQGTRSRTALWVNVAPLALWWIFSWVGAIGDFFQT